MRPYLLLSQYVVWTLPVTVLAAGAAAIDREDCRSGCSNLEAVLGEDGDQPLSLMQNRAKKRAQRRAHSEYNSGVDVRKKVVEDEVKAVATRDNATRDTRTSLDNDISNILETNKSSEISETSGSGRSDLPHVVTPVQTRPPFLPAIYILIVVFIIIFNAISWWLCTSLRQKDAGMMQSEPKIKYGVDHLVASSKLMHNAPLASDKAASKGMANILLESQKACCGLKASETATSTEKSHALGEALDPKLVLPLRETWYAVALENVLSNDGSFDVLRITGDPSIRASIQYNTSKGAMLELFCGGATGTCSNILARATMEVLGRPEACSKPPVKLVGAEETLLGELRPLTCKKFEFVRNGASVLTLAIDDEGHLDLLNASGNRLACVSSVAGHVAIFINAGADTALLICLALVAVLLAGAGPHVLPKGWVSACAACRPTA